MEVSMCQAEMVNNSVLPMSLNSPHIHIIDDELSVCTGIQGILETDGIQASYSLNYQDGLQYLDLHSNVDVILLDINLQSDLNGIDILPMIKTRHKYSQVIMFTSHDRLDVGLECMKRGAMDFMTKPFDEKQFLQLVSVAIEKKKVERIKDLYFDMVVHDLKNPLQCISASFEILQEQLFPHLSPLQQHLFETAGSGVNQIRMMICNILGITSFEKGSLTARRESFSIVETIDEIINLYDNIEVIMSDYLPVTIRTDKDLYTRILTNLVSNAKRFARIGSKIIISCRYESSERLLITSVTNEGSYISESQKEKIFTKFTDDSDATKSVRGQNFGLGLTFSKMAAEALNGTIWIESDESTLVTSFLFSIKDYAVV